ncbi:MAG: TonB family protein [Nevskiales bacterium]
MATHVLSSAELLWSQRSADHSRLLRSQLSVLGPLVLAAVAMPFLPLINLPPPVAEIVAEVRLILLPKPPPPPPPPSPREIIPESAAPAPVLKPVQAPAARPASARTLDALSRELAALGAGSNVLQSAGPGNLAKGSASSQGSGTLREGTARGSGGIGSGAAGNYTGSGLALSGHGTERVTESGSGSGRGTGSGVPGRSSAEIQTVFERNKSAVDQLYQDALSAQPGMQGEVLLKLVIEPDGTVSRCEILHSALQNPKLEQQLLRLVRTLRFGAKPVPAQSVNYPIRLFQS